MGMSAPTPRDHVRAALVHLLAAERALLAASVDLQDPEMVAACRGAMDVGLTARRTKALGLFVGISPDELREMFS